MTADLPSQFHPDWSLGERLGLAFSNPVDVVEGGVWSFFLLVESINLTKTIITAVTLDPDAIDNIKKIEELRKEFILSSMSFAGSTSSTLGWLHRARVISLGPWEAPISTFGYSARIFTSGWRIITGVEEFNTAAIEAEKAGDTDSYHKARQQQTMLFLKIIANTLAVAWSVLGLIAIASGAVVLLPIIDGLFLLAMGFWIGEACMKMHVKREETTV